MSRIATIITNGFEDSEYTEPAEAFADAGHDVVTVGLKAGETVKGKKKGTEVVVDEAVSDVTADEFDALFIPGGYSPDKLRVDDDAVDFVRDFMESDKPVFSICHGPQIMITAQVLEGRTLTGYISIRQDILNAGAEFVDKSVVEDDNLITSRNPGDIPAFIEASLNKLQEE
jgi:protease I